MLDRYLSRIQFWRAALLASVAGDGREVGSGGGLVRIGREQLHFSLSEFTVAEPIDMGC